MSVGSAAQLVFSNFRKRLLGIGRLLAVKHSISQAFAVSGLQYSIGTPHIIAVVSRIEISPEVEFCSVELQIALKNAVKGTV